MSGGLERAAPPAGPSDPGGSAPETVTGPSSPPTGPSQPPSGPTITGFFNYTVRRGDDLRSIASAHGTSPSIIAEESGIPVDQTLYPGMVLRVPTTDPAKVQAPLKAVAIPWSQVNGMWKVGTVVQVYDIWSGRTFYVIRSGGWAHADSQPVSAKDTATMYANYGYQWSWNRRPIVVTINGMRIAASQNGMPHGGQTIWNNNFPGHFCIHFLGSTTHGSSYTSNGVPTLDPAHQRCVQLAVGH
ncbi:MAG: LysM peptidoglycan-binding domain-containing protein [Bacillota bacterium]|nr:MAG: LysM peptidoglycan-binding domain-containing protein [Bacillota bacterium]